MKKGKRSRSQTDMIKNFLDRKAREKIRQKGRNRIMSRCRKGRKG